MVSKRQWELTLSSSIPTSVAQGLSATKHTITGLIKMDSLLPFFFISMKKDTFDIEQVLEMKMGVSLVGRGDHVSLL